MSQDQFGAVLSAVASPPVEVNADNDVRLQVHEAGSGTPVLFLHGWEGRQASRPFVDRLAGDHHVIAPCHPGFDGAGRPKWVSSVDDLAHVYLDYLAQRDLEGVVVVGVSLGGWVAAEIATRSTERLAGLVLVDALGIRVGGVEDRDMADIYALSREQVNALMYHDPSVVPSTLLDVDDAEVIRIAANEESAVRLMWKPYMHNPKLRRRLRSVGIPTRVAWGESDGIVTPDYGRAYAAAFPEAQFALIAGAGHAPDVEQPERLAALVTDFVAQTTGSRS
jgi:pimeloyl-ACP methyl ester carboxylesterase